MASDRMLLGESWRNTNQCNRVSVRKRVCEHALGS